MVATPTIANQVNVFHSKMDAFKLDKKKLSPKEEIWLGKTEQYYGDFKDPIELVERLKNEDKSIA